MLPVSIARACRALLVGACVMSAPAGRAALVAAPANGSTAAPGVRGLLVRLRDAPDHVVSASISTKAAPAAASESRRAAVARSDRRWRALLSATGLGAEAGLRLEPVGRNAWRVVFDGAHSRATVEKYVATLEQRSDVEWVVPNERETALQAVVTPDDPAFGSLSGQWWLLPEGGSNDNAIAGRLRGVPGFQTAWARTTGSAGTVVAVLDSGISYHPDLDTSRLLPGYDMVSDWDATTGTGYANDGDGRDDDPTDPGDWVSASDQAADAARYGGCAQQASDWHGTAVTGFLAAATDNGRGVAATTWSTRVLPVRVAGKCGAEVADIVDGMRWAAGLQVCRTYVSASNASQGCAEWAPLNPTPARVVNISFGSTASCNAAYQDAVDELHALGVVVVAAAGNGHGAPNRPASCRGVVGVAALNRDGFKAVYSNFGAAVKIATVGGDDSEGAWGALLGDTGLQSIGNDGLMAAATPTYPAHYGTSFASPIVVGAMALMLAADPTLTADELIAGVQASARPHVTSTALPSCDATHPGRCICTTATCGAGILDADQAVAYAQAHARGVAWVAPNWPRQVIANAEVSQAMALGADLSSGAGDGATGTTTSSDSGGKGGGAVAPFELLVLAGLGGLLGRRRFRATR